MRTEAGIPDAIEAAKQAAGDAVHSREARMFGRHTIASTITFLLDLAILWSLVELLGIAHFPAALIAFLIPMTLAYFIEREWVFPGTRRGVVKGFVYFAINIGIGSAVMFATFWALLELVGLHYLIARVAASVVSGIVIFLLNGLFNFKQL